MSRQIISLTVGRSRGRVGVGCKVVQFRGSIVYALRHDVLLAQPRQGYD